jgi:hypothetical protein
VEDLIMIESMSRLYAMDKRDGRTKRLASFQT